jgi:hypothetical protein
MKHLITLDPCSLASVTGGQQAWTDAAREAGHAAGNAWGRAWPAAQISQQNPQQNLSPIKPGMNGLAIRERLGQVP